MGINLKATSICVVASKTGMKLNLVNKEKIYPKTQSKISNKKITHLGILLDFVNINFKNCISNQIVW